MQVFGFKIERVKALLPATIPARMSSWFGPILESFPGAWQRNIVIDDTQSLLRFSAVYACISRIANDIAILRPMLMRIQSGIWREVEDPRVPFLSVLRRPNRFQTRIQFLGYWLMSKLIYGNTYVLKERDERGIVRALYPLDPRLVTPLVAPDGSVFYQLNADLLSGIPAGLDRIPASEVIHDRVVATFSHPLIGVSPIYSCGASVTQGIRIQANSEKFFANMSRPSGHLTAPGTINQETSERLKDQFEKNFAGANIGRLLVTGDGLKYEPMTIPFEDAQLIEQLRWTVEDVCRCFHVPLHKIQAGNQPTFNNIGAMNQDYLAQCLQSHIEAIELLLTEALGLQGAEDGYAVELELDTFLRMDPKTRAETDEINIRCGKVSPNEARFRDNYPPVEGGDSPYLQQQNYSLAALAKRDSQDDPFGTAKPAATPEPEQEEEPALTQESEEEARALIETIKKGLGLETL